MKKIISMLLISAFTVLGLVGCAEVSSDKETVNAPTTEISVAETSGVTDEIETSDIKDTVDESSDKKMLVIYFLLQEQRRESLKRLHQLQEQIYMRSSLKNHILMRT